MTLLVQSARRADARFELTSDNAAAVVEIRRRLDGLPLALELVAARLRVLSPQEMVELLGRHLDLLRGAPDPAAPAHHRTLRATIDWSYRMLSDEDGARFASLGVFSGGFDVRSAAAVIGADVYDLLDTLSRLVDHHLVHTSTGPPGSAASSCSTPCAPSWSKRSPLRAPPRRLTVRTPTGASRTGRGDRARHDRITAGGCAPTARAGARQRGRCAGLDSTAGCGTRIDDDRCGFVTGMWRYWWVRGHAADGRARTSG